MPGRKEFNLARAIALVTVLGASQFSMLLPAHAAGNQCPRRLVEGRVQEAVLALKATQYCVGHDMPYTDLEVYAHLETLRCSAYSSQLIDELIEDYDDKYRMIITTDPAKTVCKQASAIQFE